jgi:lysine 2,3-aminomutase
MPDRTPVERDTASSPTTTCTTVQRHLKEPDWRRLPGFRDVSQANWEDARWQRRNTVRDVTELRRTFGKFLSDDLAADILSDQEHGATMSLRIPPHALNTMNEHDLQADPIRRYMAPASSDRLSIWPSHPLARRDSLDETGSWAVEGLVHRYPRKVMLELTTTCPQYCGHCTRMDLVGPSTPLVKKRAFHARGSDRYELMLQYLKNHEEIHDVVVSGGDIANVPIARLERFVGQLLEISHIRSIRLASKSLISLPQYFLDPTVTAALGRVAVTARRRQVDLALHTQANHANQITALVARATTRLLDQGFRDVRNQGVLMRGVNATPADLLQLCERLHDGARIMPYYLYVCDMIPNAEHWRTSVADAQRLQRSLMGKLPGFAIPRVVCDVPFVGKRLIDQTTTYDRERGISMWTRDRGTHVEDNTGKDSPDGDYPYYDPIDTLPQAGQSWWVAQTHAATIDAAP